jgi:hypothetical protein
MKPKILSVIIERTSDGFYSAYAANAPQISGKGASISEVKESVLKSIRRLKLNNPPENVPEIMRGGNYAVEFDDRQAR